MFSASPPLGRNQHQAGDPDARVEKNESIYYSEQIIGILYIILITEEQIIAGIRSG